MTGLGVDIEVTNRCNAKCHFCPRDATPHQGLMTPATFEQALRRVVEYRDLVLERRGRTELDNVTLCGLGEPLLNRHVADYARQVREAGFICQLSTNGALLDEARGRAILDAGVQTVMVNAGDIDEAYEEVYRLPFPRTRDNVLRFAEMAGDACDVYIVLVQYRNDPKHLGAMKKYWHDRGITHFKKYDIINRGGALEVDGMDYPSFPEQVPARALIEERGDPHCIAPFVYLFIGYDGQHYLCCSDWKKEAPLGSVFDTSFADTIRRKFEITTRRSPVCSTCSGDPINQVTEVLRAEDAAPDELEDLLKELDRRWQFVSAGIEGIIPGVTEPVSAPTARHLIPVRVAEG